MLRWRLLLGTLIIGLLVGLGWLDYRAAVPGTWLAPALAIFCVLATGETLRLLEGAGMRPPRWLVHSANLSIVGSCWIPWVLSMALGGQGSGFGVRGSGFGVRGSGFGVQGSGVGIQGSGVGGSVGGRPVASSPFDHVSMPPRDSAAGWVLGTVVFWFLVAFLAEMARYRVPGTTLLNLAGMLVGVAYVGVLLSFTARLRLDWGIGPLAAMLVAVKMGDTGAYTVGRLVGRHALAPALSPKKTVEGALGAMAFSCLASWAGFQWLAFPGSQAGSGHFPSLWCLSFGLLMGITGLLGDLAESLIKRDVGKKDSGTGIPGFGGVLDMLDSVLYAGPVAYAFWVVWSVSV
jgi:phosphatidate cytidylyltransferase